MVRRYGNLLITMVLGGLWHGSSWTFVFWGALHGIYLCIHHGYRALVSAVRPEPWVLERTLYVGMTFVGVTCAWVFFRATTFSGALAILHGMGNIAGQIDATYTHPIVWNAGLHMSNGFAYCGILAAACWLLPNTNSMGEKIMHWCQQAPSGRVIIVGASLVLAVTLITINALRDSVSAFIYFNF
jgi:alginate O-acetyltransferase complex protein AlgI